MAFPTPLTVAQVAGAEKGTMTDCYFVRGVDQGKIAVVALNDVNLAAAVAAGDVMLPVSTVPV
jgi:hypothetical protein